MSLTSCKSPNVVIKEFTGIKWKAHVKGLVDFLSLWTTTGHHWLLLLIQDFIYEHIIVVSRHFLTQLLSEGQGDGVGFAFGVFSAALQVVIIKTLPSPQTVPGPVEAQARHQNQVQTSCMVRAHNGHW